MKKLFSCFIFLLLTANVFAQANNNCANATLITTDSTCVTGTSRLTGQTLFGATSQNYSVTSTCSQVNNSPDVWYKFVAKTKYPTITVSNPGTGLTVGNIRIQLLSGTCGVSSFTEKACGVGPSITPSLSNPLTEGTTYYIRIHRNNTTTPAADWTFTICVTDQMVKSSRMNEVFSRTVLSGVNAMYNPWEITYGPDNYLWVTEGRGYKVHRIDPNTGVKTTVLDLTSASTDLTVFGADSLRAVSLSTWGVSGVPWPQGGLAGLALHPNFLHADSNFVYISYVHRYLGGNVFRNKLVRFKYNTGTGKLGSPIVLCDTLPGSNDHNSQRIFIAPEYTGGPYYLYYASGDMGAGQGVNPTRPIKSQLPNSYEGKILRFNLVEDADTDQYDKWIPNSNPYNDTLNVQSAVWNIGIRNNQGFAYDAETNTLYGTSHGAYSDDEVNILLGHRNYGHPLIIGYADGNYDGTATPGLATSYSAGTPFGSGSAAAASSTCVPIVSESGRITEINAMGYGDYKDPLFSAYVGNMDPLNSNSVKYIWSRTSTPNNSGWPSEGLSGLDIYTNKVIPGWKRSLIASGLKWGRLLRLKLGTDGSTTMPSDLSENNTSDTVLYLQSSNRYRDIAFGPNGKDIFVIMDRSASSVATDGNPPVTPGCADCLIKYTFLGYQADAAGFSTISKSIDVTTGVPDQCNTGTTITIDGSNNYIWVPITGPDGNILAEINANGNILGQVTSSFYQHSGSTVRVKSGYRYLNRNITITPQFAPTLPSGSPLVKIRLYISKNEFNLLDADLASGLTGTGDIGLLRILKNDDPCRATILNSATALPPSPAAPSLANLTHGPEGYVLQADISSFSSFYFGTANMTLPMDLLTFTGTLQNDKTTLLKWKTENEINTSHFVVERSTDGSNFNSIGTVSAAGNSVAIRNYSLIDIDAANQQSLILYYRLKMVDINGEFKYSNVISVTLADITGTINLAPNPVTSEARVTITAPEDGRLHYKIVDNAGRTVLQKALQVRKGVASTVFIDMKHLSSGMYFLNVTGAGLNKNLKVQKQ